MHKIAKKLPQLPEHATLPDRWNHWYVRAEATFEAAAGDSRRNKTREVERTKG